MVKCDGTNWIEYDGTTAPGHGTPSTVVYYETPLGNQIAYGVTLEDPHDHHDPNHPVEIKVRVYLNDGNGNIVYTADSVAQLGACGYIN